MANSRTLAVLALFAVLSANCAGRIHIDKNDPVQKQKAEFLERYGFYITDENKVDYYKDALGVVDKEKNIFKSIKTVEDLRKFEEIFWKVRDINPKTPENEFKSSVDKAIQEIQNEALLSQGVMFKAEGGLTGDIARVYLLRGQPSYIVKAQNMAYVSDLMAWVYGDMNGRPIFVFLFYEKGFGYKLFKNYSGIDSGQAYADRLREVARFYPTTDEEYAEIEREIFQNDDERIFTFALMYNQFSYYSDIVVEGGNGTTRFGALDPPEPAALTAKRFKPTILGQPNTEGRTFIDSAYPSLIPAELRITKDPKNGRPSLKLNINYLAVDWEIKGEQTEVSLDLRISFQNKKTREIKEFLARIPIPKPKEEVEKKRQIVDANKKEGAFAMNISLDNLRNFVRDETPRPTLRQIIDGLEPGEYIVNIDLRHTFTKKYNTWREEITIK